jgi:hypothetical protein
VKKESGVSGQRTLDVWTVSWRLGAVGMPREEAKKVKGKEK